MKALCEHEFVATPEKGRWRVKAMPVNNRGEPRVETVSTTLFECAKCGGIKEYPDTWERNYVVPDKKLIAVRHPRKKRGAGKRLIRKVVRR